MVVFVLKTASMKPQPYQCDLFHVLRCCRQQCLSLHFIAATEARITVAIQFFGVGETALYGFFSSFINQPQPPNA